MLSLAEWNCPIHVKCVGTPDDGNANKRGVMKRLTLPVLSDGVTNFSLPCRAGALFSAAAERSTHCSCPDRMEHLPQAQDISFFRGADPSLRLSCQRLDARPSLLSATYNLRYPIRDTHIPRHTPSSIRPARFDRQQSVTYEGPTQTGPTQT